MKLFMKNNFKGSQFMAIFSEKKKKKKKKEWKLTCYLINLNKLFK